MNTIAPKVRKDVEDAQAQKIVDDAAQKVIDDTDRADKAEVIRLQKIQDTKDEAARQRLAKIAQDKIKADALKLANENKVLKQQDITTLTQNIRQMSTDYNNIEKKLVAIETELNDKTNELNAEKKKLGKLKSVYKNNVKQNTANGKNKIINDEVFANDDQKLNSATDTYKKHKKAMDESQIRYDALLAEMLAEKHTIELKNDKLKKNEEQTIKELDTQAQQGILATAQLDKLKSEITGSGFKKQKEPINRRYKKETNFITGRGVDINENKKDRYAQFQDNYMINVDALRNENMLIIKYIKNRNLIPEFTKQRVSQDISNLIIDLIKFDKIDNKKYESLNNSDKLTLVNFLNACHVDHNMHTVKTKEQIYQVLIGELRSGNNSENIKHTLKTLIEESLANKEININEALKVINKFDL